MRVWVKSQDLSSVRRAQYSSTSAAVSISASQSSSLVMPHPSKVEMFWRKDFMRFICCWVSIRYLCLSAWPCAEGLPWVWGVDVVEMWQPVAVICQQVVPILQCAWVGWQWVPIEWVIPGVVESAPVTLLDQREPHCIGQIIHHLIWVYCGSVVYCPWDWCLWEQVCPRCHHRWRFDFYISLSCCEFCCIFCNCWAGAFRGDCPQLCDIFRWICGCVKNEGKVTYQAVVVQSLVGGYDQCIMRGFFKCCWLNPVSCWLGECLLHLLSRYCWLFNCEVSHHSTSVKVQDGRCPPVWR